MVPRRDGDSPNWGGPRPNSGRPRVLKKYQTKAYSLDEKHVRAIARWRKRKRLASDSAAVREMIEEAADV